MSKPETSDQSD